MAERLRQADGGTAGSGPAVEAVNRGGGLRAAPALERPVTGARVVVDVLAEQGVEVVFGIPGGAVLPLYDVLYDAPFNHVLVRHEQAAALAADGYARASGRVGVCIATSGPGVTNLVTGLATAHADSVPVVALTGNVPRALAGTDAFQETDAFGVTLPVTKHNYRVRDPGELAAILREAFRVAARGRPGPVLVDIPKDILAGPAVPPGKAEAGAASGQEFPPAREQVAAAAAALAGARRPVLYAGGGVVTSGAAGALRDLAQAAGIPVTTTLMALGAVPGSHSLFLGLPGMHGTYAANLALTETDCLVAVGTRFDDRVTGRVTDFAPAAVVIHIDVDAAEHGKIKGPRIAMVADARQGLSALTAALAELEQVDRTPWLRQVETWQREHPYRYSKSGPEIKPQAVIQELERATAGRAVITTGVGQHQMWAAMYYRYNRPRQFLTSGGLGTMGYGLPAAIGAQLARPDQQVVCVDGDGSFQMNSQELATLAELNLPVKVFILNNGCHGMVRQWQEMFHGNRLTASVFPRLLDFAALAGAYGIRGMVVDQPHALAGTVAEALAHEGPVLVDCRIRRQENVLPMVPPGAALKDMVES